MQETTAVEEVVEKVENVDSDIVELIEEIEEVAQETGTESITYDYTEVLQEINGELLVLNDTYETMLVEQQIANEYLTYIAGFGLFAVIVVILLFSYKFFKIFI